MNVVARTLAAAAVVALLVPVATAQDLGGWREMAARDAQRVREAQRAELIRAQYERQRSMAHARLRSGDSSTLYASTLSAADVQLSCPVEPAPGMRNVIELVIDGRHDNPVSSAGGVAGPPGLAAPFGIPRIFTPVVPQASPAWDFDTVHAGLMVSDGRAAAVSAGTAAAHGLPFLPSASDARGRQGIAHVLNRSAEAGEVRIVAVDDSGRRYGPLTLSIGANETVHVSSEDMENGNADKGLFGATGPGVGDWRLELSSDLDIEALSYVRASDGLVTAMHDVAPSEGTRHRVPLFNAASDFEQESRLRLINPGSAPAEVAITGIDSQGTSPGDGVAVTLPAGASLTYTAAELESGRGAGLRGSLGDGAGEWRLNVESEQPLRVMSLVSSPTGHLTNLSTAPSNEARGVHRVPLFPATSDPSGRQGLVRVVNRSDTIGDVRISAFDDTQWEYAPLVLPIGAGETAHLNSNDLEQGNPGKGLSGGTGAGQGDWRLELTSDVDIEVLSYVRAWDGLLTAMHDVVPSEAEGTRHRVAMLDPQGSPEQERVLRLINPGGGSAEVEITGVDARGRSLGDGVAVTLPAGVSRTYTAAQLQTGAGAGLRGSLNDGTGEWRLTLKSEQPLQVMSLLSGPSGHLSNLSTAPVLVPKMPPPVFRTDDPETPGAETPEDVFRTEVSPIVQAKCVLCHRAGGFPADAPNSRLQFNPSTVEGHVALNLAVFEALIAVLEEDEQVEDPVTYILNKVQGVSHGGLVQAAAGTDDYASLERFLGLLSEAVAPPVGITPETLFEGVTMESARSTLRRAAIVLAGRVPTDAEYAVIEGAGEDEDGSEEALRAAIRGLMIGPDFHEFLIRASNDQLLTDRELGRHILSEQFVDHTNKLYDLHVAAAGSGNQGNAQRALGAYESGSSYGTTRAPLELIAYVVENDLPYTEILTADYNMANPQAAVAYGAATEFADPTNAHDFKPSRIVRYFREDESQVIEEHPVFGHRVIDPGDLVTDYPHAGILNTTVFLLRYPTTATNRNRARSRWTYYHFLGLDIEKSASRTTDPVALSDTNNPTLNNPACTVCHSVMDPVAGAFQNYGDEGWYRDQRGGLDSLDQFYKEGPDGPGIALEGRRWSERRTVSWDLSLKSGENVVAVWPEEGFGGISLDRLDVFDVPGERVLRKEFEDLPAPVEDGDRRCGETQYNDDTGEHDYLWLWGDRFACAVWVDLNMAAGGTHTVEVVGWSHANDDSHRIENDIEYGQVKLALNPYQEGDSWYRDMRQPGIGVEIAPNGNNSLQWLAQQIVAVDRFAESTVKFWWPAIMGAEVAEPPEDENDANFQGLLLASNAQAAEVTRLAGGFRSGFHGGSPYNGKDLLVEIVLSKWFRAASVSDDDAVRTTALAGVGARRLLTPEELARKTHALTGFQWGRTRGRFALWSEGESHLTDTNGGYALLYGGIDSDAITERARDFTSMMAGVAQSHALRSSNPIVMREFFLLPEEKRLLFDGVNSTVTPVFEFGDTFEITAASREERETVSAAGDLTAGESTLLLSFVNNETGDEADRNLRLDRLEVRDAQGGLVASRELEEISDHAGCQWNGARDDHFAFYCEGVLDVSVSIPADGRYSFEVVAWADQNHPTQHAKLELSVESNSERSAGARHIRAKLVDLFHKLHGIEVTADSPEVNNAYELFVDVWDRRREERDIELRWNFNDENLDIDWASDQHFFDGIADDLWRKELEEDSGWELGWDWPGIRQFFDTVDWSDPHGVAETWAVVLAYLMMDYRYLYL